MDNASVEQAVEQWLGRSEDDLATAGTLLENGRYNWCAFICQQSLEKCLKAGYVKMHRQAPPYVHNLERLLSLLEIAPPNRILDGMIEIDKFYLTARYPSYKEFVNITDGKTAKRIFENTKESYEWLKQTLTL